MALQPAAGTRDLNPGEVDRNRRLSERLARVYRLWGYEEVAPPTVERLDTLAAGLGEDSATLEAVVEPYLLQLGILQRTPRGRLVTPAGRNHLGWPAKAAA